MRSIFLRIFTWFWVTLILVGATLVVLSPLLTRTRPRLAMWEEHAERAGLMRIEGIAAEIEREGPEGLLRGESRRRRGRRGRVPVHVAVYDSFGEEITGRPPTREERELAIEAMESGEAMTRRVGSRHLTARPVTDPGGRSLAVVGILERPPRLVDLLEPGRLLPVLGVLALVGGVLVLWLAHHLSAPVLALRSATRDLAAGDLAARVSDKVTRRSDELGELGRDFDAMAEHVERLVENQRQLLGDVSHELRSPLARLNVALELARRKAGEGADEHLDRIALESSRLDDLIGRLLELARLEQGPLDRVELDLEALVRETVADANFESGGAEVRFTGCRSGAVTISANEAHLRSAIDNVVRNAVAFNPADENVEVALEAGEDLVHVRVLDRGPGVPEDRLERIFDVFYRVEEARDRGPGGVGLGLAIAARAVARHGGSIRAENRDGGGLEVEIALPRC